MITQLLANSIFHKTEFPALQSILPAQAINQIYSGRLPEICADKLVLKAGEKCHYVEMGAIITERKYTIRYNSGVSNRWWKGFTHHINTGESIPQSEPVFTKGFLFFTDTRVVFVASKNGFEQKIDKLSAITAYADGVTIQFGNKAYTIMLPNGNIAKLALDLLV